MVGKGKSVAGRRAIEAVMEVQGRDDCEVCTPLPIHPFVAWQADFQFLTPEWDRKRKNQQNHAFSL